MILRGEIVESAPAGLSTELQQLGEDLKRLLEESVPENTRRAYRGAWERFSVWCVCTGQVALPARMETVALYVAALKGKSIATIRQTLSAIACVHGLHKLPNPCAEVVVRMAVKGIAREKGGVAGTPKRALIASNLRIAVGPPTQFMSFREARRRAVLVLGFFAAMRRSELVALRWCDLEESHKGLDVCVRRSKTDQSGKGQIVALPYQSDASVCPVRVLATWRRRLAPTSPQEFVFPSIRGAVIVRDVHMDEASVVSIVKDAARRCGLPVEEFAAHSLRSGFATTAAEAGKRPEAIQAQLRHRSPAMVLRYVQRADRWVNNAAMGLGG